MVNVQIITPFACPLCVPCPSFAHPFLNISSKIILNILKDMVAHNAPLHTVLYLSHLTATHIRNETMEEQREDSRARTDTHTVE